VLQFQDRKEKCRFRPVATYQDECCVYATLVF
jgi:hypothetical protein